ncbi:N-acetyl sugar amidotransferase [Alkaliphilus peptidifermentans]|uniref:N-acetyl sugar amidotransferase n=1 Tax=Alkaliphilus peptidifermentans DSM 18978 TaxID=1120976 RepID=A0A1G5JGC7_9FIRM|nr:N-acetyl sugar amidotransferase [Alkaliphilus peptidifermentans]SCY86778.1 N-acetyl sugar amidotransferase [Alkaliphilus peptidifermentans DSM 18978]
MKYCKKCLQPDTRPGIKFNEDKICYACLYEEEKKKIDWETRKKELIEITEWAKEKSEENCAPYDCVIGVSGGKDSTLQAIYAKEKLGLKVLLVNCEPDEITEVGKHNIENLIQKGFDIIKMRPNPQIMKKITKDAFYRYGNPVKPSEYPLWASAYIIALRFDIPLIIQGENAALTLGVVNTGLGTDGNAVNVNEGNTLAGGNANDWVSDDISLRELYMYQFPDKEEIKKKNIKAIYLQYYLKEWSTIYNQDFAIVRGLLGRSTESLYDLGRYRRFSSVDSDMQILNQMIKYYKFGFGSTTDQACCDIREGRLSREDAIWLVEEYDGKCGDKYISEFCKYINITVEEFWNVTEKFINKKIFNKDIRTGKWLPKFKVGEDFDE